MSHGAAIPLRTLHTAFPHERHCAEQGSGADAQQPLLVPRSGSWARLTASVRRQRRGEKTTSILRSQGIILWTL